MAKCGVCLAPPHFGRCFGPEVPEGARPHFGGGNAVAEDPAPIRVDKVPSPAETMKELKKVWAKAILETDRHSTGCKKCFKRKITLQVAKQTGTLGVIDPYVPCKEAVSLHAAEVEARKVYLQKGGKLG